MLKSSARRFHAVLLSAASLFIVLSISHAAEYPTRPVRLVVPFPPGGGSDVVARTVASHLTDRFNQTVLVDNRRGAAGILGTDIVAKAPNDGHTLLLASGSHSINSALREKLPYDAVSGFTAISRLALIPNVAQSGTSGIPPPGASARRGGIAAGLNFVDGYDPSRRFDFADLADDVIAIADAAGAQRFHYCGEAFGGTLGMQIAAPVLGVYLRSRPEQVALLREHVRQFSVIELPTDFLMIYNVQSRTCAEAVLYFAARQEGMPCTE